MAKKKVELTLEELQAKKSKRQRGWVRFCAIVLAVLLTGGIYGTASKGGPRKQKFSPSVVQVNGGTVVQKSDNPPAAPAADPAAPAPAPAASEDEGGGILDTLMGLLSGIDFGSLVEKLNPGQLGITVADKIDTFRDNLIDKINEFQSSINKKPVITHESAEEEFVVADEEKELNSLENREALVKLLNDETKRIIEDKVNYTLSRTNEIKDSVNIGSKTNTVNTVLATLSKNTLSLDGIVSGITGGTNGTPQEIEVDEGSTMEQALSKMDEQNKAAVPFLRAAQVKALDLTADDIKIVAYDPENGEYEFYLKNVTNPNRAAASGLTKFTDDFVVQDEVAEQIKKAAAVKGSDFGLLKLTDLQTRYENIYLRMSVLDTDGKAVLDTLHIGYDCSAKFVVRSNAYQITGTVQTSTASEYEFF